MIKPIFTKEKKTKDENDEIMRLLLDAGKKLGLSDIVIPFVDSSSMKNEPEKQKTFIENIKPHISVAEKNNINFSLETDLDPGEFKNLLSLFDSPNIKVNYDMGNSASLGYDPEKEFAAYGHKISDVHIKDRKYRQGSVELGQGDVDFKKVFSLLKNNNYDKLLIFQAYRDDEGLEVFKRQREFMIPYIEELDIKL